MGLFDNIIGTATEGVEPLGMDTIVDDSVPPIGGGGGGGSGGGSGSGGAGQSDDPNVVSGDKAESIIIDENTPAPPAEIPNIDIGGDMFNFSFSPPPEATTPDATGVTGAIDAGVILDTIPAPIDSASTITEVSATITEVSPADETVSLIDISSVPPEVTAENPAVATITEVSSPESIDMSPAPEAITIIDTPPSTPVIENALPIVESITEVVPPLPEVTPAPTAESEAISKTLESLNDRITLFISDLEALRASEAKRLIESEAALAKIEEKERLAISELEEEKKTIEATVKKIQSDEKKIEETIALLSNNKII